jgi:hypothetical protein
MRHLLLTTAAMSLAACGQRPALVLTPRAGVAQHSGAGTSGSGGIDVRLAYAVTPRVAAGVTLVGYDRSDHAGDQVHVMTTPGPFVGYRQPIGLRALRGVTVTGWGTMHSIQTTRSLDTMSHLGGWGGGLSTTLQLGALPFEIGPYVAVSWVYAGETAPGYVNAGLTMTFRIGGADEPTEPTDAREPAPAPAAIAPGGPSW